MNNKKMKPLVFALLSVLSMNSNHLFAQAPSGGEQHLQNFDTPLPPPPAPTVPLDGGLSTILIASGIGYAFRKNAKK